MTWLAFTLVSVALAAVRVAGHRSQAYQAAAHLWVGGLIGAYLTTRRTGYLCLTLSLSAVELGCFLYFRFVGGARP